MAGIVNKSVAKGPIPVGTNLTASTAGTAVNISGNIIPPAVCKINNDISSPDIDFGNDVRTDLIDGKSYHAKQLPVIVSCTSAPGATIQFSMNGTVSNFDSAALTTNVAGLGIKIYDGDKAMDINSWGTITYNETLNLTVVPVKSTGAVLAGGDFNATGTLVMRFE